MKKNINVLLFVILVSHITLSAQIQSGEINQSTTQTTEEKDKQQALQHQSFNKSVEQQQSLAQLIEANERLDEDLAYGIDGLRRRDKKEILKALEIHKKSIAKKLAELELITPETEEDEQVVGELTKTQKILLWTAGSIVVVTTATGLFLTMYDLNTGGIHAPSGQQFYDNLTRMFATKKAHDSEEKDVEGQDSEETTVREHDHVETGDTQSYEIEEEEEEEEKAPATKSRKRSVGQRKKKTITQTTRQTRSAKIHKREEEAKRSRPQARPERVSRRSEWGIEGEDDEEREKQNAQEAQRKRIQADRARRLAKILAEGQADADAARRAREEASARADEERNRQRLREEAEATEAANAARRARQEAASRADEKRARDRQREREEDKAAQNLEAQRAQLANLRAQREALEREAAARAVAQAPRPIVDDGIRVRATNPADIDSGDETEPDDTPIPPQPGWLRKNLVNRPIEWIKKQHLWGL